MPSASVANLTNILRTLYADGCPEQAFEDNVLLARVPKKEDFYGENYRMSGRFTRASGVGATFSVAQGNAGASDYSAFLLTRERDYGVVRIDNEAMEASSNRSGAVVDGLKEEMDSAFAELSHRINKSLFGNQGGSFARIASVATDTITVEEPLDLIGVEVGQFIQSAATDGTSGSVTADQTEITAIDREAGTITAGANWAATFDVGDYLFVQSDFGNKIAGLASWLPTTVASNDSFFGQNRFTDRQRLAGLLFNATEQMGTLERTLIEAAARAYTHGGRPTDFFMHPEMCAQLDAELGSRVRYERLSGRASGGGDMAKIGFEAICLVTPAFGKINIFAERDCPQHVAYGLDMRECCFKTLKSAPRILTYGDGTTLRIGDEDGVEARMGWYGQFGIRRPGNCVRVNTTAVTNVAA